MSVVTIAQVKKFMRVFITSDDELILDLIEGSEAEALQYMDRTDLPREGEDLSPDECDTSVVIDPVSDGATLAPNVRQAIYFLVQSKYEGQSAEDISKLRDIAFTLLAPHRRRLGA